MINSFLKNVKSKKNKNWKCSFLSSYYFYDRHREKRNSLSGMSKILFKSDRAPLFLHQLKIKVDSHLNEPKIVSCFIICILERKDSSKLRSELHIHLPNEMQTETATEMRVSVCFTKFEANNELNTRPIRLIIQLF